MESITPEKWSLSRGRSTKSAPGLGIGKPSRSTWTRESPGCRRTPDCSTVLRQKLHFGLISRTTLYSLHRKDGGLVKGGGGGLSMVGKVTYRGWEGDLSRVGR
jgi:hypothetical protein